MMVMSGGEEGETWKMTGCLGCVCIVLEWLTRWNGCLPVSLALADHGVLNLVWSAASGACTGHHE